MNDLNTNSEVKLLSDDELSCEELGAVSAGECTNADREWVVANWQNPLARWYLHAGCPKG